MKHFLPDLTFTFFSAIRVKQVIKPLSGTTAGYYKMLKKGLQVPLLNQNVTEY
jgi:hypothetical protein